MSDAGGNDGSPVPPVLSIGMPERYSVNIERYEARGGQVRPSDDLRGFVANDGNASDMARFYAFCLIFDQIVKEGLTGDLAELGVYKGHTASLLALMARRLGSTVWLLDTFEGFDPADLQGIDSRIGMGFEDTSVDGVKALVGEQNVKFVQGHFPSSADELPAEGSYCLVHLDCDLYAPMLSALDYFYPRMVPGGFLIMHDYSSLHWNGAERAVDEFFAGKNESIVPLPDMSGSVVVRKVRPSERRENWFVRKNARLFRREWTEAARGNLSAALGHGWSSPEDWGVWGVDDEHELAVFMDGPPTRDIELEFDVATLLTSTRDRQDVDVLADGTLVETWTFTTARNRGVRELRIPAADLTIKDEFVPAITLTFRPKFVTAASDLDAASGDDRRLGLALHRVRRVA